MRVCASVFVKPLRNHKGFLLVWWKECELTGWDGPFLNVQILKNKKNHRVSCKPVKQNVEMHNSAPLSCSVDYFKSSMGERLKIRGHYVFITANKHVWLIESFEWKMNVCRTVDRRQMLVGFLSSVKGVSEQSLQWSAADHCIISHFTIMYILNFFPGPSEKLDWISNLVLLLFFLCRI